MADNTILDLGTGGDTIATDDIGGVKFPRTKLVVGADGVNDGDVASGNPLPIKGTGTAGSANTGVVTIQGIASMTAVAVTGTFWQATQPVSLTSVPSHAVTNAGTFVVQIDGAALTSLQLADDVVVVLGTDTYTEATSKANVLAAVRRDADTSLVNTTNEYGPLQMDALGRLKVEVFDGGDSHTVDGTVSISGSVAVTGTFWQATQPVSGTVTETNSAAALTALQLIDNAVSGTGFNVSQINGVAPSMGNGVSGTGVQRVTIASDSTGVIGVTGTFWQATQPVSLASVPSHAVTNTGTFAVQIDGAALTALQLADNANVDHDAAAIAGVVQIGLEGRNTEPTALSTTGDATRALATMLGKQIVVPYAIPASTWSYAAASGGIVNTTGVTAKAAAGANIRNYVTRAQIINAHATVSTDVQIRDGAAGTVLWRGFAQAAGGGVTCVFDPPLRGTANTLIEIACGTTGTATYFNLQGYSALE